MRLFPSLTKISKARHLAWLVLVCFVLSLGFSLIIWNVLNKTHEKELETAFLNLVQKNEEIFKDKILLYEEVLRGGAGLFYASETVTNDEWLTYVDSLSLEKRYPHIRSVSYVSHVVKDELPSFLSNLSQERGFNVEYKRIGNLEKDDHFIVTLIDSEYVTGFDVGGETRRREAAEKARDTGNATLTKHINLATDERGVQSMHMFLPVYEKNANLYTVEERRAHLEGWIIAPLYAVKIWQDLPAIKDGMVKARVYEGIRSDENLLYASSPSVNFTPKLQNKRAVDIAGQNWLVEWESSEIFERNFQSRAATVALVAGVIISILVTSIVWLLIGIQRQTRRVAQAALQNLSESEKKFEQAFQYAAIGIALVSPEGGWLRVNDSLCDMLGYSEKEFLKTDFQSLTHPDDLPASLDLIAEIMAGKRTAYTTEKRYFDKKGHTVWTRVNVSLVRNEAGEPLYFISQIENITQRKQLDEIKSNFISVASHQFRTPLSAVRWFLEMILDGDAGRVSVKQKKLIEDARAANQRMIDLTADLLRVSRLEARTIKPEKTDIDLKDIITKVKTDCAPLFRAKEQRLRLDLPAGKCEVSCDPTLIEQVIVNLVSNAHKYSPNRTTVTVRLTSMKTQYKVEVIDAGIGISEQRGPKVFQKFSRGQDAIKANPDGSGLGLYIARSIIELSGGKISFRKNKDQGTTFWFTLPR